MLLQVKLVSLIDPHASSHRITFQSKLFSIYSRILRKCQIEFLYTLASAISNSMGYFYSYGEFSHCYDNLWWQVHMEIKSNDWDILEPFTTSYRVYLALLFMADKTITSNTCWLDAFRWQWKNVRNSIV